MLDRLLHPPNFEKRCTVFLDEVRKIVVPKYPDLDINETNVMEFDMKGHADVVAGIEDYFGKEEADRFRRGIIRRGNKANIASAFYNFATVDVFGGSPKQLDDIIQAADDIEELSERFAPEESYRDENLLDVNPNIHLSYFFY